MNNNKMCILIVDDETRILRALKDFLSMNNFNVISASDGAQALDTFYKNNNKIDIILLDIMMPYLDGMAVLSEIRESSLVPIIMLTAKGEEYDQLKGFNAGADDYIQKPFSPSLLLARINAVLKRTGNKAENEIIFGKFKLNIDQRNVTVNENDVTLTPREFDLLHYLMINRNIILSREQILNAVWGYEFDGDERTVDTHIKQLRNKLSDHGANIRTIHKIGYKFEAST